jgi:hypothetical protein
MKELRLTLAKSTPDQICRLVVPAQNGGELLYECPAACQRDFDSPQASTLGSDIEVPPCRSALPACKGQKKLLAIVPSV